MATYAELQTKVERRVIDLPTAVQTEVPDLVNEALRTVQRRHNFQVMRTTVAQDTVVGTRVLMAVPSDFKEFRGRPWVRLGDGTSVDMTTATSRNDLEQLYGTASDDDGRPQILLLATEDDAGVGNFEVWPLPDGNSEAGDGEYEIVVPYWRYLPALSNDADANWITDNMEYALVELATSFAFSLNWDAANAQAWRVLAEDKIAEAIRADKKRSVAGVTTLVPFLGAKQPHVRKL